MQIRQFNLSQALGLSLVMLAAAGCGYSAQNLSLDKPAAEAACAAFLEAWRSGKKPADLKPDIIVGDFAWEAGQQLASFEVLPNPTSDGTNLHITVRLWLKDADGKESQSAVTYVVGTSPVVTIFRD